FDRVDLLFDVGGTRGDVGDAGLGVGDSLDGVPGSSSGGEVVAETRRAWRDGWPSTWPGEARSGAGVRWRRWRCRGLPGGPGGGDFRPPPRGRRESDEQRLQRMRRAMERQERVPPVELYQLGSGYYVLDGHHRVATAKLLGQVEIDANVI